MKMLTLAAAGLTLLAGLAPTAPAAAQDHVVVRERTVVRHENHGWHHRWHRVCDTRWRHGHRVRVCRQVRW